MDQEQRIAINVIENGFKVVEKKDSSSADDINELRSLISDSVRRSRHETTPPSGKQSLAAFNKDASAYLTAHNVHFRTYILI